MFLLRAIAASLHVARVCRLSLALMVLPMTLLARPVVAPKECRVVGAPATGPRLFLEVAPPARRDTLVNVRLCMVPGREPVGSYHALFEYDTLRTRVLHVDVQGNGMQAANPSTPGATGLAGAAPTGFNAGVLARLSLRGSSISALGSLKLVVLEINSTKGTDLRAASRVTGFPAANRRLGVVQIPPVATAADTRVASKSTAPARPGAPHITSLTPSSANVDPDAVVEVVIHGLGFAASGNVVMFGPVTMDGMFSADGGRSIRFIVPTQVPSHGEVPPMRILPGEFAVRVRTPQGESNSMIFKVSGDK
jgi:hypothetical protein